MAKQKIEIGLSFSADTSKAKGSLQQLEKQLNSFMNNSVTDLPLTKNISAAQEQAAKLSVALKQAVNIDTGKFDLSKFQSSLKKSNTDLKTLRDSFVKAGPEGTKTFMALAQSIVAAEVPTKRMNAGLEKMLKTLKDTARWQISSNIMHGLQGALQDAYGYAQDLNKSLNDIRIVTGYSTDQMEDFAVSANKAAKALSTTTNEYTKASLIYFQQGLSDQEVTKRTQTTIKMANVTGEAAEDVSSYMTAVWNNFDDGSKKLEYYADAITALGAATASSSEEIATGLQKFSAVASTVGLSYEYATAALATVTSQTRESAETVGTAFKTIFARLESLSLGETLDDDTTMTKYSQALAQVGVNIKTANGDLKDMDTILDELGVKWNNISKDQQIALAQTVAGMRQYNNFIALLDNYETMKLNVEIAADSEGTLDEQANIYAESWEAASNRVRAAAETIYAKILDDDFFIDLLNGFEKLLELLDKFIDSTGGLQGILFGVSSILLKTFSGKAAEGLENMTYNVKEFLGLSKKEVVDYKDKAAELTKNLVAPSGYDTPDWNKEKQVLQNKLETQLKIADIQEDISATALEELRTKSQINDLTQEQTIELTKQAEEAQKRVDDLGLELKRKATPKMSEKNRLETLSQTKLEKFSSDMRQSEKKYNTKGQEYRSLQEQKKIVKELSQEYKVSEKTLWDYYNALQKKSEIENKSKKATKAAKESQEELNKAIEEAAKKKAAQQFSEGVVKLTQSITGLISAGSMIGSMVDTLMNPDTSGWEKFLSIFTTMTMVIPMLSSSIKAFTEIQWKSMVQTAKETIIKLANAAATKAQVAAEDELNNSKSGKGKGGKKKKGSKSQIDNTKFTAETWKGLGKIAGKVGLIAAAIAVVVGAIALIVYQYNKADKAAQNAEANAKAMREEAQRAKDAYKELGNTIEGFEEGQKALKTLTKGTLEYKEALQETNAQAIELIRNNASLSGKYQIIDGQIVFDEGVLEDLQAEKFNELASKEAAAYNLEIQAIEARNNAQVVELAREVNSISGSAGGAGMVFGTRVAGAGAGALAGLAIGGPVGAAIGAAVGAAVGTIGGTITAAVEGISSETEKNRIDEILKKAEATDFTTNETFKTFLQEKLKIADPVLVDSLVKNREALEELSKEVKLEAEQTALLREQMVNAANQDLDIWDKSIYKDAMNVAVANEYGYTMANKRQTITKEVEGLTTFWSQKELNKRVAEAMGVEFEKEVEGAIRFRNRAGDDTLETYRNGQWVAEDGKNTWSRKQKEELVINSQLTNLTEEEAKLVRQEVKNNISKLTNIGLGHDTALKLTTDYIRSKDEDGNYSYDFSSLAPSDLYNLKENLLMLDGEAYKDAVEAWTNKLDSLGKDTAAFIADENGKVQDSLSDMSADVLMTYGQQLNTIFVAGGEEARNKMAESVDELLNTYPAQANQIMNIVNSIDWRKGPEAFEQLKGQLYDIGIILEDAELEEILNNLNVSVLVRDLNTVKNEIKEIGDLAEKISFGSVISEEDYKLLTKYNAGLKERFIITAEGYRYIDNQSLRQELKDNNKQILEDTLSQYAQARNGVDYLNNLYDGDNRIDLGSFAAGDESINYLTTLAEKITSEEGGQAALIAAGFSSEAVTKLVHKTRTGDEAAREELQKVFEKLRTLQINAASGTYLDENGYQLYASTLTNIDDLNQAMVDGLLGTGKKAMQLYEAQSEYIKRLDIEHRKVIRDNLSSYYDFAFSRLENGSFNLAEKIDSINSRIKNSYAQEEYYTQKAKELAGNLGINYSDNASASELLGSILQAPDHLWEEADRTLLTELQNGYTQMISNIEVADRQMADALVKHFSDISEQYDKVADKIEKLTNVTEHYKNILDLTGRGMDELMGVTNDTFRGINQVSETAATNNMKTAKETLNLLKDNRLALKEQYDEAVKGEKVINQEYWDEQFKNIDNQIVQSTENFYSSWEDAIKAVAQTFEDEISYAMEELETSLVSSSKKYLSLEDLQKSFDQQSILNEQYLSDYEKIYKLTKLTRDIENSINNSSNIKSKKTLKDLQSEIIGLQESGKKLSDYDLEYLQKKYELKQAEIALEDIQSAKQTVRLQRDASGNWGYIYTSNEEVAAEAIQNYEDKLFELQQYSEEYMKNTASSIISIQKEYQDALQEIAIDQSLSVEEKQAKFTELTEFYTERLKFFTSEYDEALVNSQGFNDEFKISFEQSVLGTLGLGVNSASDILNKFIITVGSINNAESVLGKINTAVNQYTEKVTKIFSDAGQEINTFGSDINKEIYGEDGTGEKTGILADINSVYSTFEDSLTDEKFKALQSITDKINEWWGDGKNSGVKATLEEYLDLVDQVKTVWEDQSVEDEVEKRGALAHQYKDLREAALNAHKNGATLHNGQEIAVDDFKNYWAEQTDAPTLEESVEKAKEFISNQSSPKQDEQPKNDLGFIKKIEDLITTPSGRKYIQVDGQWYEANSDTPFGIGADIENTHLASLQQIDGNAYEKWLGENIGKSPVYNNEKGWSQKAIQDGRANFPAYSYPYSLAASGITSFEMINPNILTQYKIIGSTHETPSGTKSITPYILISTSTGAKKYAVNADYFNLKEPTSLDTGGYTGQWGPEGRLAMLHQKEIVLNASDTSNLLASVSLIRDITKQIDLQAAAAASGLGSLAIRSFTDNAQTLQQDVTIHAEFPNVTDHNEIEQAFDTLINRAAQYTNRNF